VHWTVAAPFFDENCSANTPWLDDFVPSSHHSFTKVPHRSRSIRERWHMRSSRNTPLAKWLGFWQQAGEAWQTTEGGVITVFPQLAAMTGLRKRFSQKDVPLISWCFNVGALYPGLKQVLSQDVLQRVDRFVVHSKRECETVSAWLNLPQSRFEFVPLQRAPIPLLASEEVEDPFVLAMGSANRDYETFFAAVEKLGVRTIVVASPRALPSFNVPANVELRSGLTFEECHRLAQQARVNVVPLIDHATGAGQVTIIEAMRMSRPLIATRCTGSEDYIQHGETGLFVQPHSVQDMTDAIAQLWSDETLRGSLGQAAGHYAAEHFSDEAAGSRLGKILDQF
jgi:hypothetical protein